jgi:phosphatidate cytidylyltransferase
MSRNLLARLAVAAVAIPIILWICYRGGWWLLGMVGLFAVIAAVEFIFAEGVSRLLGPASLSVIAVAALIWAVGGQVLAPNTYFPAQVTVFVAYTLLLGMGLSVQADPPDRLFARYCRLLWGVAYIGFLYPFVFLVGHTSHAAASGGDWMLFLFGLLWVGDTVAMAAGAAIGGPKLAPTVSPNKTVAGFIGGVLGALVVGMIMYFWKLEPIGIAHVFAISFGCSVFGQLGDLVESMWKRSIGIKDSSTIIPGHGGILDRFDSLLFAAPFMYFYLTYVLS